ncbi:MAG: GtrA family protein [Promicromonosporaceae bacterium]|nr:GtrA family protein [Promicromonosporaceae bacterium]
MPTARQEQATRPAEPAASSPPPGRLLRLLKDQRIAFLAVGAFNTAWQIALFAALEYLFGTGLGRFGYLVWLVVSYAISICTAFLLHRYLVFRVRGQAWLDFVRFVGVNLVGLGLNFALLTLAVEGAGMRPRLAQPPVALAVAIASYLGHKHFSFRRQGAQPSDHRDRQGGVVR